MGESISPLAKTGIETELAMFAIVSYSASPLYPQLLVRPCTASALIPASSAILATVRPFLLA
jgi:hypothetical protein